MLEYVYQIAIDYTQETLVTHLSSEFEYKMTPTAPALQAIDESNETPTFVSYEMVFNLGAVNRL